MHTNLVFGTWSLIPLLCMVAGKPVPDAPLSPIAVADDVQRRRAPDQPLTLVAPSTDGTYLTLHQPPNYVLPPTQSNATIKPSEGFVPYRVPRSHTTLFFHHFGPRPPTLYILDALALSLVRVLKLTKGGKGKDNIRDGMFIHTHVFPNNDNVSITVWDFREVGKPMNYYMLRDTLVGIAEFMGGPEREVTPVSYEIEVDERGYVGTGHIDYNIAGD